ncbi:transcriptional regulator [Xanthobacter autotrophicus]|uniref:transcriptional regulator n=1 Tax=Xanthobacter autotrophicus TaxID=280 RepID=UPI00372BAF74
MEQALALAIEAAGGVKALGHMLGITHQAVGQWRICPPRRVLEVERASGISRFDLRPDIYPPPARRAKALAPASEAQP